MAVKKLMNTFFASLQEQNVSGFGSKIVNTPMGPFTWNDTLNVWVNMNNGMVMNNISFQDSMAMMDYSGTDDGNLTSGIAYGTIPMVFTPTIYNITSNYGVGSSVTITPSILVPVGTANFKMKWISDGGFGGTLSELRLTRNRSGTNFIVSPFFENTNIPGGPATFAAGDILTLSAHAPSIMALGTEQYSLYFYNNSGTTLSEEITINVNIPPVLEPELSNTTERVLQNITVSGCTYVCKVGTNAVPEIIGLDTPFTFLNNNAPINLQLYYTNVTGSTFSRFAVDSDANADPKLATSLSVNQGFTVDPGVSFRVGAFMQPAGGSPVSGSGNIIVYNNTAGSTLATIPYSFNVPASDTVPTISGNYGGITATTQSTWYGSTLGGATTAGNASYVTYNNFTQAILVGASFTNQTGPIVPGYTHCGLFIDGDVTYAWGTDNATVNFEDFNNRFPLFPEYRLTLRLILSGVGTGTGSGNVLIYDFTNNNTLATIPYEINIP